ncbi:MAG: hypothetical protein ACRD3L_03430 [Terriglobales bacterium]
MKHWPIILLLLSAATLHAGTINEADYAQHYEVMNGNTVKSWMIGNFCTMAVRAPENTNLILILQKRGHGGCHVPDAGTTLQGRREKNEIHILMRDDRGKPRIEKWPIVATSEASTRH